MFGPDFYPTGATEIERLIEGLDLAGHTAWEPEVGKGNIVKVLKEHGAEVLGCELHPDLHRIGQTICKMIGTDMMKVTSDQISHIDFIIMNPPYSQGAEHILHAYSIAPPGCKIRALVNLQTLKNPYSKSRKELETLVDSFGSWEDLGKCFEQSERPTSVETALVRIDKPGANYSQEFEGFFLDEDPEQQQANALISYNVVRDLVNRYVNALKIFDEQLTTAVRLSEVTAEFYGANLGFQVTRNQEAIQRNEFKKEMQKAGWKWIFEKMNMAKYATRGLREDINKFVEKQTNIPFTMKNIYKMLEIVVGTAGQRMDKAILEVFDKVTSHHSDNRLGLEGWKTNSHYLLTKRFILPGFTEYGDNYAFVDDLIKALCYISGENFDEKLSLSEFFRNSYFLKREGKYVRNEYGGPVSYREMSKACDAQTRYPGSTIETNEFQYGQWLSWDMFKVRKYKKGTVHFEFADTKLWERFNARVAKLKGYPLMEAKKQTDFQKRGTGRPVEKKKKVFKTLSTIEL